LQSLQVRRISSTRNTAGVAKGSDAWLSPHCQTLSDLADSVSLLSSSKFLIPQNPTELKSLDNAELLVFLRVDGFAEPTKDLLLYKGDTHSLRL
jgi:hypothetical protein